MSTDDARTRILQAAGPVFADRGFQSATIRDICHAASVNQAAVNYYFRDKERLYIETVKAAQQRLIERVPMRSWPEGTPAVQRLSAFIETLLTRVLEGHEAPWQSRLMVREILNPSAACQELVEEYFRPQFAMLLDILRQLAGERLEAHELEQIGFSIVGQCVYYRVGQPIVDCLIPQGERDEHYSTQQLATHITRFSLGALQAWNERNQSKTATASPKKTNARTREEATN